MRVILDIATEHRRDVLFRLLQYSLFEESLTDLNEMREDALFEYPWFDAYFTEPEREAYFLRDERSKKLLGFAMINTHTLSGRHGHSIAEFMVLPKYRRQGIGMSAAHACFDLHSGYWEIVPSFGSESAYRFWKRVIDEYAFRGYEWKNNVFSFYHDVGSAC